MPVMIRLIAVCALLVLLNGFAQAQPPELSGKWSGRWVSDKNGHSGPLHARFRQLDGESYRVAFRGRFWGVFPFFYRTTMNVEGSGEDVAVLTASQRLGPLGTFTTTAVATSTSFDATFSSRNDSGRFVMSRRR
jgi:hypothetical protein